MQIRNNMEKISVNKKDSVPRIVEKILESGEESIVLVIPYDAEFDKKLSNFELIRREAEAAGKSISVVSEDEETEDLARRAGIMITESRTRRKKGEPVVSDIIPVGRGERRKAEVVPSLRKGEDEEEIKTEESKTSFWDKVEEESGSRKKFGAEIMEQIPKLKYERREEKKIGRRFYFRSRIVKIAVLTVVGFALVAGSFLVFGKFFDKAEVSLTFKKSQWQNSVSVTASKTFSKIDGVKGYLPAEVFKQQKNEVRLFPASGVSEVSEKATANIVIYNSYSSSKQTLVAATRFSTPDGKIFRLDSQVVVPGAVVKDGKITPSSIEASLTADKAGAEYNAGPFEKLTIPSFKGTPRYDGFYASMSKAASGGFVGTKKVPTDADISSAKEKAGENLKNYFATVFLKDIPQGFRILEGASSFNLTKISVNKTTDEGGNFSVFSEASFQAIGFKDDDMKSLLNSLASKDYPDMDLNDLKIDYSKIKVDFSAGQITFSASSSGILNPRFSENDFKSKIAGKSLNESQSIISPLPYLESAKVSLWPFWVSGLPENVNKIKVTWN